MTEARIELRRGAKRRDFETFRVVEEELDKREPTIVKSNVAPTNPATDLVWIDTTTVPNIVKRWTGTAWEKSTPEDADEITATATRQWQDGLRRFGPGSTRASNPCSGTDAGTDATINIAANTAYAGDGTGVQLNSGSIVGAAYSTFYAVYADLTTLESGAQTVTYYATTNPEELGQDPMRAWIGNVTTPAASDPDTSGTGGDGGGGTYLP